MIGLRITTKKLGGGIMLRTMRSTTKGKPSSKRLPPPLIHPSLSPTPVSGPVSPSSGITAREYEQKLPEIDIVMEPFSTLVKVWQRPSFVNVDVTGCDTRTRQSVPVSPCPLALLLPCSSSPDSPCSRPPERHDNRSAERTPQKRIGRRFWIFRQQSLTLSHEIGFSCR